MNLFLVFDFETTGFNGSADPVNYPTQFACKLTTPTGIVVEEFQTLVRGAKELSEWSKCHCPHVTVKRCEEEGIELHDLLKKIVNIIEECECTLVAHNMEYDWDKVLLPSVINQKLYGSDEFQKLRKYKRICTMLHEKNRYWHNKHKRWCGPSLQNLADKYNVEFDSNKAHDAMYDTDVTKMCLVKMLSSDDGRARRPV